MHKAKHQKSVQEQATDKYLREERHKLIFSNLRRSIAVFMMSVYFMSLYLLGLAGVNPFSICSLMLGVILLGPDLVNGLMAAYESIFGREPAPYSTDAEYSIARTLANKGLYSEAEIEYERIATENPDDPKAHIQMIEIAAARLNDAELAEAIYKKGMLSLKSEQSKAALTDIYDKLKTLIKTAESTAPRNVSMDSMEKSHQRAAELRQHVLYGTEYKPKDS